MGYNELSDEVAGLWRVLETHPKRLKDCREHIDSHHYATWCCPEAVTLTLDRLDQCMYFMVQKKPERCPPYVNSDAHPGYRWVIRWIMP